MQFLPDGPEIPVELLEAQERGDVVFVCGAGVSRGVDLPSFWGLVEDIYTALGETWVGQPAEAPHMGDTPALDRALFALQTRMGGADARAAALTRERITAAVQRSLAAPAGAALPDHLSLLKLSRDADMRRRIVTTNFDTLFERAARQGGLGDLPSRAAADLPGPGTTDFVGVLHLHGRLADAELGLSRTDLVLNSAEFGEAYLRAGWAARYVYDLARASTIVIVGYAAEDPPVRYLLEVLSADRARFRDLRTIYAFAPYGDGFGPRRDIEARSLAQGITPLCYEAPTTADHSALYRTLAAWSDYAEDPTAWRRSRARDLLAGAPDALTPADWVSLRWALGRGDAARILVETNPDPVWLAALRANALLETAHPAAWIEARWAERPMLEAALQPGAIDRRAAEDLQWALTRAELAPDLERAWRLLLKNRTARNETWDDGWFDLRRRIQRGDAGLDVRQQIVRVFAPRAEAQPVFRWPDDTLQTQDQRLMEVRYRGPQHADPSELLEGWPPEHDAALLRPLVRSLEDHLEEAADNGFAGAGFDRASFQVKSVARHAQDSLQEGFYPLVRVIADLLERLDAHEPAAARAIADQLQNSPFVLARRIYLHALALPRVFSADEAAAALLGLDDEDYWVSDLRRELMRLTALRWADFSDMDRDALERRVLAGAPRRLFADDPDMEEQIAGIMERETFVRLARQERVGPGVGEAARARIAELRAAHPRWGAEVGERAEFSSWSEMRMGEQGEPELLDEVADEDLVERAAALAEADPMEQGEIWRKFVSSDPTRAFDGLVARSQQGEWPPMAWIQYFWGLTETDDAALEQRTVAFLDGVPGDELARFGFAVSAWFVRRKGLPAVAPEARLRLWDHLLKAMVADPREAERDGGDQKFDVLNRTPGHLARQLVREVAQLGLRSGDGIPQPFRDRMERLIGLEGDSGGIAVTALVRRLPYLHDLDPAWTEAHLLPFLATDHPWAPSTWTQLAGSAGWRPALVTAMKDRFLATFTSPQRFATAREYLVYHLVGMAMDRVMGNAPDEWPLLTEVKAALAASNAAFRQNAAFRLFRMLEETEAAERPRAWREVVGPLFEAIWPMAPALQSDRANFFLISMVLRTGDEFPSAVAAVAPALIGAGGGDRDSLFMLRDEAHRLLLDHPHAALALLDAIVERTRPPRTLGALLDELAAVNDSLRTDQRFERLLGIARQTQA